MSDTKSDLLAPLLALVAKWREEAKRLRALAGKSQRRGDLTEADVRFAHAQDADGYADELQAAISSLAAHRGEVEPVAWKLTDPNGVTMFTSKSYNLAAYQDDPEYVVTPLYLHPPQAQAGAVIDEPMILRGGRALSDKAANDCCVNAEDNWKTYSEDYMADALTVLSAALGAKL